MEQQLLEVRDQQKASWNKFSPGWKKWDEFTMDFLKPAGDEIIRLIGPRPSDLVLDIAGGTGQPGLTIAAMAEKVVITDLADGMMEIAKDNAARKGINNVEFRTADVCELPFPDNTFDAVSCRFGFMFFPDMELAAREIARVLKPGGRVATSVWNVPDKNFWVTAIMDTIKRNIDLPPQPPGSPSMFRCAKDGLIAGLFSAAGLKNVSQKEVALKMNCGTPETFWDMMTEVGAPIVAALSKADQPTQAKIKKETLEAVREKYPDPPIRIDCSALVIYGEK